MRRHTDRIAAANTGDSDAHPVRELIRIGCAGWNIPRHAAAHFAESGTHLEGYSQIFNCCEINSSFYRPHKYSTWERWAAAVPKDFRFSVKVPRTITHEAGLRCEQHDLMAFLEQVSFLSQKLGLLLVQLPPSNIFDLVIAKRFFTLLREAHPGDVALEARHQTWFASNVDDLLSEFRIAGVAADPACVPAAGTPAGFKEVVYFRLHGSPRRYYSSYPPDFLKTLASRMADLSKQARVWCIFDNTAAGFAMSNALQLRQEIGKRETELRFAK
jgi:uncharacterized protein YecE (DUF72 family)